MTTCSAVPFPVCTLFSFKKHVNHWKTNRGEGGKGAGRTKREMFIMNYRKDKEWYRIQWNLTTEVFKNYFFSEFRPSVFNPNPTFPLLLLLCLWSVPFCYICILQWEWLQIYHSKFLVIKCSFRGEKKQAFHFSRKMLILSVVTS